MFYIKLKYHTVKNKLPITDLFQTKRPKFFHFPLFSTRYLFIGAVYFTVENLEMLNKVNVYCPILLKQSISILKNGSIGQKNKFPLHLMVFDLTPK
jgi:hypothetical protein